MARQTPYDRPFEGVLKGVAAGLVGTLAMTTALQAVDWLMRRPSRSTRSTVDDGSGGGGQASGEVAAPPPTEQVAERLAKSVFQTELSAATRQRLGVGVYWAYGAFWGALSAQLQLSLRPPTLPYGVLLGLAVWLVGPMRLVPALGLYVRPASSGWTARLIAVGLHVVYGTVTALTLDRLTDGNR